MSTRPCSPFESALCRTLLGALLLLCAGCVHAPPVGAEPVREDRAELLAEIVRLADPDDLIASWIDKYFDDFDNRYPTYLVEQLAHRGLDAQLSPKLSRKEVEASGRRFQKADRHSLETELDWRRDFTDIYQRGFGDNFTDEELRDLVMFFRTPTGRKALGRWVQVASTLLDTRPVILGRMNELWYRDLDREIDLLLREQADE